MKIAAYIAALRLKKQLAERKAQVEQRVADRIADYGDNGTEGVFYLVDNFR